MALVNPIPVTTPIPHEAGAWFELRRLSHKQLKAARKEQQAEDREDAKALGAEFIAALSRGKDADIEKAQAAIERRRWRADQFDRDTVLRLGVAAWSYEVPLTGDALDQLDEETAKWAHEAIVEMSRPATEDERKNDSASSTVS